MFLTSIIFITGCGKEKTVNDLRDEYSSKEESIVGEIEDKEISEFLFVNKFDEEKITRDLTCFFEIYDEKSYNTAESNLTYTEDCQLNKFFKDVDDLSIILDYTNKPEVLVTNITQEVLETSASNIGFTAKVEVVVGNTYHDYLVFINYNENYEITNFERYVLN